MKWNEWMDEGQTWLKDKRGRAGLVHVGFLTRGGLVGLFKPPLFHLIDLLLCLDFKEMGKKLWSWSTMGVGGLGSNLCPLPHTLDPSTRFPPLISYVNPPKPCTPPHFTLFLSNPFLSPPTHPYISPNPLFPFLSNPTLFPRCSIILARVWVSLDQADPCSKIFKQFRFTSVSNLNHIQVI